MEEKKVRTRFAPSPTGYMHVGNLRTALYAYLTAKHAGGTFILRIEDTDQERYVDGAVDVIYDTCREAGLLWDEGPDVGGPVGPYVQSERMGLFKQYAEQLVADGKAYYCFCTNERLDALHAEQRARGEMTHYDGCCRDLPPEEVKALNNQRRLIETVIAQLTERFNAEKIRARDLWHLTVRISRKLLAHSINCCINQKYGNPLLQFERIFC